MPHSMPPPSKAGPAEQAQAIRKLLLPSTISPLVPMSMNRLMSSVGGGQVGAEDARRDVAADIAADAGGEMDPGLRVDVDADLRIAQVRHLQQRGRVGRQAEVFRIQAQQQVGHDRVAADGRVGDLRGEPRRGSWPPGGSGG